MIEPAEPPHHHHHRTGIPWFDLIMPLAVISVSVASLLTSLHSEKSMEALVEQNSRLVRAQSTPLLTYDTGNTEDGKPVISMVVRNVGTGPAEVFWFHATDAQGVDYTGGALSDRINKSYPNAFHLSEVIAPSLMRRDEERVIFKWPKPSGNPAALSDWEKLNLTRRHLHLSACYCSMFDECRITDFGVSRPKPVNSCEQGTRQGQE